METDNVAIMTTTYGGHIGFMEGLFPTRYHFSDRLFEQFAGAVFQVETL
jgi:abhydrolase domain-containing protein 1/3